MPRDEIYPNPPVVLVAAELKHPVTAMPPAARDAAKRILAPVCPIYRPIEESTFTAQFGPAGTANDLTSVEHPRFMSRDRSLQVVFRPDAVVVETAAHRHFGELRSVLALAIQARQDVEPVDAVERLGIRYIDEIRTPDPGAGNALWAAWISPVLLGPAAVGATCGLEVAGWHGLTRFDGEGGRKIVLRYGAREGYAVDPGGELRRQRISSPGPFFLLDIDSFWMPDVEVPPVDGVELLEEADRLHTPIRALFESLITDRLRDEVLRNDG